MPAPFAIERIFADSQRFRLDEDAEGGVDAESRHPLAPDRALPWSARQDTRRRRHRGLEGAVPGDVRCPDR